MMTSNSMNVPNGRVLRTAIRLVIYSEFISPAEISERLNLRPTKSAIKGVKFGHATGTPINIPRHMWQLSSEHNVEKQEFSSHLDWLLSRLLPINDQLRLLRKCDGIECMLLGNVWTANSSAHLRLSAAQTKTLYSLQLDMEIEFSDYGDD